MTEPEVVTPQAPGGSDSAAVFAGTRWWMPLAVFLPALALRVWGIGSVRNAIDDARVHVLTGLFYWRDGMLFPDAWWSPPLKHLFTGASIGMLGNDVIGWRLKDVLFGALAVYLVFLLARRLFRHTAPALVAAMLMAVDPFSISLAHTTHEDVPAICFALLACVLFLRGADRDSEWEWLLAGVSFGLALALRWYVGLTMLPVAALAVWWRRDDAARLVSAVASFTAVPLAAYLATYLPWFSRGYSLADWAGLQADMLAIQGSRFKGLPADLAPLEGAHRWFVEWVGSGAGGVVAGRAQTVSVLMNDPVVWVLFVPSALMLLVAGVRTRRPAWTAVAAAFLATYGFVLISPRPVVLYSAMAVVPLGFVCVGFAATRLLKRRVWWFAAAAGAWSLYLFPLVSGAYLYRPAYEWLLRMMVA